MRNMRTRQYIRYVMVKHALRKRRITEDIYYDCVEHPYYNNLHQYSKNKIHCSCPMCSCKTKRRRNPHDWGPGRYNYSASDQRKIDALNFDDTEEYILELEATIKEFEDYMEDCFFGMLEGF